MMGQHIRGCRILLVEDEYLLADDLTSELTEAGVVVCGPVATVAEALEMVRNDPIDAAILDVNLGEEMSFPVADALRACDVPFLFMSGHDRDVFPARFADVTRCAKPLPIARVVAAIGKTLQH